MAQAMLTDVKEIEKGKIKQKRAKRFSELLDSDLEGMIIAYPYKQFTPRSVAIWALQNMDIKLDVEGVDFQRSLAKKISDKCKRMYDDRKLSLVRPKARNPVYDKRTIFV